MNTPLIEEFNTRLTRWMREHQPECPTNHVASLSPFEVLLANVLEDQKRHLPEDGPLQKSYKALADTGRASPHLYDMLVRIYAPAYGREFEIGGGARVTLQSSAPFAACHAELPGDLRFDYEHVFGPPGPRAAVNDEPLCKHPLPYDIQGPKVPKRITEHYGSIRGGEVFAMQHLQAVDGRLELAVRSANYGQVVDTCDALTTEAYLLAGLMGDLLAELSAAEALQLLPWRKQLHDAEGGDLLNVLLAPKCRAAGLGMACLTLFDDHVSNDGTVTAKALYVRRPSNVAVLGDIYHVVPAGMCACFDEKDIHLQATDMITLLYKEFLEELFDDNKSETMRGRALIQQHVMDNIAPRLYIDDPDHRGVELRQTGLTFDLSNLRPEISVINRITNPRVSKYLVEHMKPNWEAVKIESGMISLATTVKAFEPKNWVQSGAVTFRHGVNWLARNYFET